MLCLLLIIGAGLFTTGELTPSDALVENNVPVRAPSSYQVESEVKQQFHLSEASQWDIFGVAVAPVETIDIDDLPETALSLGLIGTFTSTRKNLASAIINVENKGAERIYLNGNIIEGVSLHAVLDNEVILLRGTVLESLKLYDPIVQARSSRPMTTAGVSEVKPSEMSVSFPVVSKKPLLARHQTPLEKQQEALQELRAKKRRN